MAVLLVWHRRFRSRGAGTNRLGCCAGLLSLVADLRSKMICWCLFLILLLPGCYTSEQAELEFAKRQVQFVVYGIYGVSPTGVVMGIGYVNYQRNLPLAAPLADKPSDVLK